MRYFRPLLAALPLLVAATAASAEDLNATATVQVVDPIGIVAGPDLYFGAFLLTPSLATNDFIRVRADGGVAYSNVGNLQPMASYPPHRAAFTVTGAPNFYVTAGLTPQNTSMGPGLTLENILHDEDLGTLFLMEADGEVTYYVGGTMRVTQASNVTPGTHSTTFVLTVEYQ